MSNETFANGIPHGLDRYEVDHTKSLRPLVRNLRHRGIDFKQSLRENRELHYTVVQSWMMWLQNYSRCGMTKEEDVFVAIQSVSEDVIVNVLNDRVIAGMLESRLVQSMCWRIIGRLRVKLARFRPEQWRAPSWSWASTLREVTLDSGFVNTNCTKNTQNISVVTSQVRSERTGKLSQASLWITGRPFQVQVIGKDPYDRFTPPRYTVWSYHLFLQDEYVGYSKTEIVLDEPDIWPVDTSFKEVYLILLQTTEYPGTGELSLNGLALMPYTSGFENICSPYIRDTDAPSYQRFRRIGNFHFWDPRPNLYMPRSPDDKSGVEKEVGGVYVEDPTMRSLLRLHESTEPRVIELV